MGISPIWNCLIANSKDKQGGNFFLEDLNNQKGNKNNNINNDNVCNSNISKENQLNNFNENKKENINSLKNNSSSMFDQKNESVQGNSFIIKNKMNKDSFVNPKKKDTQDSTDIALNKEKENKKDKKIEKENKEIKKEDKIKEDKIKEEKIEKEKKKKEKKKIEKSKFAKTIIICGPIESGKTSFSMRYCDNKFDNCYIPSFANEISSKQLILNQGEKRLQLKFIVTNNIDDIDDVDCYFVIYDVNSNKSYYDAKKLIEDNLLTEKITIFLIGNKSDLKCVVNKKEVDDFCIKYNLYNYYISVKNNIGISSLMQKFAELFNSDDN